MTDEQKSTVLKKVLDAARRLWESRDVLWTQERVQIKKKWYMLIEVTRWDEDEPTDENGEPLDIYMPEPGTPTGLELYVAHANDGLKGGFREVDCCTVLYPEMKNVEKDAEYLIDCYG